MASWIDVFSLITTTLFFVGVILGVLYATHAISERAQSTKESLERRGITISREGVSLKSERRFDRERYLDATQRGLVKALNASTVGSELHRQAVLPNANGEHEKSIFGVSMRRSRSDERREGH